MIEIKQWRCSSAAHAEELSNGNTVYETAIVSSELSLDERSSWVRNYVSKISRNILYVNYDRETDSFSINNNEIPIFELNEEPVCEGKILIDTTSLEVPEIVYTIMWLKENQKEFDVLYVEPSEYQYLDTVNGEFIKRIYSISEDGPGINLLSRFLCPTNGSHIVISLGFEGHRFGAILQSDEFSQCKISGLVGVPPFNAGWERRTYAENCIAMDSALSERDAEYFISGANDPLKSYTVLDEIYKAECEKRDSNMPKFHVAPFGTKPVALAMIIFAINHKNIGIVYDFLRKKNKGSKGKGKIHIWRLGYSCKES